MAAIYSDLCVALIGGSDEDRQVLQDIPNVHLIEDVSRGQGRYVAIEAALATQATHLHYIDMDRLLH